jgi:hypothetical protein
MSCIDEGQQATQKYVGSAAATLEISNPPMVIYEILGLNGEVEQPPTHSPRALFQHYTRNRLPEKLSVINVLKDLEIAEKVARRQYDEILSFPLLKPYIPDITHIRNDEYEHMIILGCIVNQLINPGGSAAAAAPQNQKIDASTPQAVKNHFFTALEHFDVEEQSGIKDYADLLQSVNDTLKILAPGSPAEIPLIEIRRKIMGIVDEEQRHVDTIKALKALVSEI